MVKVKRVILCLWVFFTGWSAFSQPSQIHFEHLTMKDGLSMNPVMAILQDQQGFLWFATQDGLNRYDGYSFSVFKSNEEDSSSISDNFITSLALDPGGDIWIGTLSRGVNRYSISTGKFIRYEDLPDERIWCLFMDDNGILWVGTENGPYWIDSRTGKKATPPSLFLNSEINSLPVTMISKTSDGTMWIGTTFGLFAFGKEEMVYRNRANDNSSISNDIILSILEDKNKQLWIGTLDGFNKLLPDGSFERIWFKEKISSMFKTDGMKKNIYSIINNYSGNTIRTIWQDVISGLLWIGTDMELVVFNPQTGKFRSYQKDLLNPFGINDHFIRSMYCDRSGNLWIGTLGNGLNKVNLKPDKFKKYSKKINDPNSLSENYVRAICEDEKGRIWVGSLIGGLDRFDPSTEMFYNMPSNERN
jgi:ligand-binding sensor domain-containing protein